jgi:phosphomannomutase
MTLGFFPCFSQRCFSGNPFYRRNRHQLGICSSDALYFAVGHYGYDGGLMITASHNPAIYNGLKFCRQQAIPLSRQNGLLEMQKLIETKKLKTASRGRCQRKILSRFTAFIFYLLSKKNNCVA